MAQAPPAPFRLSLSGSTQASPEIVEVIAFARRGTALFIVVSRIAPQTSRPESSTATKVIGSSGSGTTSVFTPESFA